MGADDLRYLGDIANSLFKQGSFVALTEFVCKSSQEELSAIQPAQVMEASSCATAVLPAHYLQKMAKLVSRDDRLYPSFIGGFRDGLTSFLDRWNGAEGAKGDVVNLARIEAAIRPYEDLRGVLHAELPSYGLYLMHRDHDTDVSLWDMQNWSVTLLFDRRQQICHTFAQYKDTMTIHSWGDRCSGRSWVSDSLELKNQMLDDLKNGREKNAPEWVRGLAAHAAARGGDDKVLATAVTGALVPHVL